MTFKNAIRIAGAAVLLCAFSVNADEITSAYVAENGRDVGNCDDPATPCRTIGYAIERVSKLGDIRVAEGRYPITTENELFILLGDSIEIRGGFDANTNFRSPSNAASVLVGMPAGHSEALRAKGFHAVSDGKALSKEQVQKTEALLAQHAALSVNQSAAPCTGGSAGGFSCDQVGLLSHVALGSAVSGSPARGNDIWGFLDLNTNREYALMGYNNGSAVFDVTDPANPREIGFVDGQNTTWRDVKVYQTWNATTGRFDAYAYVTTDGSSDGLFVIDLTELPHRISRVNYASDFSAAHNVFATDADYATGLSMTGNTPALVIAGSNNGFGIYRRYDLSAGDNPAFTGMPGAGNPGYMHDAASMLVTDSRKDSQCVNAAASPFCEVLFDFNETTVDIWDITNPTSPALLSRTGYSGATYTHSGWWTEDKQYLYVHDELDEQNNRVTGTTVHIFSLANLNSPALVGSYTGNTREIDHNGFTRGNRYYMSNYSAGLTVLDVTTPTNPVRTGFLDTFPGNQTGASFSGAWGVYPFLPSGTIAVSDRDSGLYLLSDDSLNVAQGSLAFAESSYGGEEGSALQIAVSRNGGSTGAISVGYELVGATGSVDDVTGSTGTLNWADGDTADKIISLQIAADGQAEDLERLLIRLTAPTGGATLAAGSSIASVYLSEAGATSEVAFFTDEVRVAERGFGTGIAIVNRTGSAVGAASVDFAITSYNASTGTDFSGPFNGTIQWADGDADPKLIEYDLVDDGVVEPVQEFIEVTLSNPTGATVGAQDTWRLIIGDGNDANNAPIANPGPNLTVEANSRVLLDGGASSDPDGDDLTYQWSLTMGPGVVFTGSNTARATFDAPDVASDTLMQFSLTVTDERGLSDVALKNVTVLGTNPGGNGGGGGGALGLAALLSLGGLLMWRRRYSNG